MGEAGAGLEVHASGGRPRLAVVRREGDPMAAVAIEIAIADGVDAAASTSAIAALVGGRLRRAGMIGVEEIAGARFARVRALVPQLAAATATAIDQSLRAPVDANEPAMKDVRRALAAFVTRPVDDPALARAARCLDRPTRPSTWTVPAPDALPKTLESWRAEALKSQAIVVGATASSAGIDAFAKAWSTLAAMPSSPSIAAPASPGSMSNVSVGAETNDGATLVVEGAARATTATVLASLSDPDGPLAVRLRGSEGWRAKSIAGAARPDGACFVVELEARRSAAKEWNAERAAMRAAVALEIARQEIDRALDAASTTKESDAARVAIGSGGDPREAADRAAWWAWLPTPSKEIRSFSSLIVPLPSATKGASPNGSDADAWIAVMTPKLAAAISRAKLAWARPELDVKSRVESGQGELWALVGSPCGVAHETTIDAGLASIAMTTLVSADATRASEQGVFLEPWVAPNGVGVVAHAAARTGESAHALAQRIADVAGRAFLASLPRAEDVVTARADALVVAANANPAARLVLAALAATRADHPSFLAPFGDADSIAHVGLDSIELRLATLRASSLRLAVVANADEEQVDAAARAADRWAPRNPGETRACPAIDAGATPKGSIHAVTVKAGTGVAFAFPVDEPQREAATLLALSLVGPDGALGHALEGLASVVDARCVRGLDRSALVVVALAPDANVDAVAAKLRAFFESLRSNGVGAEDFARAEHAFTDTMTMRRLDPRARLVDLFLGDATPLAAPLATDLAKLRALAAKLLDEDRAQVVLARTK